MSDPQGFWSAFQPKKKKLPKIKYAITPWCVINHIFLPEFWPIFWGGAKNFNTPYLAHPKTFLENTFFILKPPLKDMVNNTPRDNCRKWIFLKALAF